MEEESNEEIDREFKELLTTCSFCDVVLDNMESVKKCKLLQCLHSICDKCVIYLTSQGNKDTYCPKCTLPVNMDVLMEHKILEELIAFEDETNVTCAMHPNESVTHWCNNCLEYICEVCIKLHLQLKATKEHDIISKMEYLKFKENKQGNFPCKLHPTEQLTLLCTKCMQMTCRDCQLDLHREHGHEFVGNAVVPAKKEILLSFIQLEHHKLLLDEAQKLIKERRNEINQRKQEVQTEINNFSQNLINVIMKWTKSLLGNLDMVTSKQLTMYDTQSESVKDLTRPIIHTLKFVKKALKTSSDTTILYYKDVLVKRMSMLNRQKVLIPNSAQQTRIKFTYGNVNHLIKVLQSFGEVCVYDQLEDGTTGSDEISGKLTTLMAHLIKQQEERCKGIPLTKPGVEDIKPFAAAAASAPPLSTPPNYHVQQQFSSNTSQHMLQQQHQQQLQQQQQQKQHQLQLQQQHQQAAQQLQQQQQQLQHIQQQQQQQQQQKLQQQQQQAQRNPYQQHSQPGFPGSVNMSFTEMRVHTISQQLRQENMHQNPQRKYSSTPQFQQHQNQTHSWTPSPSNIGPGPPQINVEQRNPYAPDPSSHHSSLLSRSYDMLHQSQPRPATPQQQQQQQQHQPQQQPQQSSCLYQNVQFQPYPPPPYQQRQPVPQLFPHVQKAPAISPGNLHFNSQNPLFSERIHARSTPQPAVASWHTPQPRSTDKASSDSGANTS